MTLVEVVRYQPGEAIRWIQTEAERLRQDAKEKGKHAVSEPNHDFSGFSSTVKNAASAVMDLGKSAYAEIAHIHAKAQEYALLDEHLDIVKGGSIKSVKYSDVKSVSMVKDKATFTFVGGSFIVKPHAYIVAGPLKVPVGWTRNGLEVPYYLLIEELAARCKIELES